MDDLNRCPACGHPRPADAPAGLCPVCLLRAGRDDGTWTGVPERHELTVSLAPASSSVLAHLAATLGGLPRVLLRDTDPGEEPSPVVQPTSPEMPAPDQRPDRYQLFGEIAHGGMGAVLKGRDAEIGRDLAIKVLLEAHTDKPELVRRFLEEAQIGGQLQHPGVVPIYDLGSFADRRPFFTMKLVKGQTLAALLQGRKGPADERPRLLGIFEAVCQTMAYAHTRGVIHRDLKPSNIMVGSFGEVQVMDWGLAKVLPKGGVADDGTAGKEDAQETVIATARSGADSDLSRAGSVLGTPAYMAPEQARGEIDQLDERADVFALGSILCEILTGKPAFSGGSAAEILRQAGRGELGAALASLDACGAEPELTGLAKECLAAERDDRPRSARAVAAAMTAYLAGVQERLRAAELARVEADARAAEERKRRKLTLALAASIIGTLVMAGGGWAWNQRQRQERRRERQERAQRVELVLREAQLLRGQAERAGDDRDHWNAARDAAHAVERLAGDAGEEPTRQTITELVHAVTEGAAAAERDRQLLDRIRDIRAGGDEDPDGSVGEAKYAAAFREASFDVDTLGAEAAAARIRARPPEVVPELAPTLDVWAVLRRRSRPQDMEGWQRLVAAARAVDPDPLRDRLRDLWSEPDPKAHRGELLELARQAGGRGWPVASLSLLGQTLLDAGERDAMLQLLRRAQLEHPNSFVINANLGENLRFAHPPRIDEAIRFLSVARVLRPETGHNLAHLLEARGQWDEARAIFEDLTRLRPGDGYHWACLGIFLRQRGDRAADAALEKAVAVSREALRLDPDFPHRHCALAMALAQQGKPAEAIAEYREGIRLKPDDATARDQLAMLLSRQGRLAEAIATLREGMRLTPSDARAHYRLGNALAQQGKGAEAIAAYREALRLQPEDAEAHTNLGLALRDQGKPVEAIAAYREAIRINPDFPQPHNNLGAVLCDVVHDYDGAAAEFRTALRLQPDNVTAQSNLGESLWWRGEFAEAAAAFRRARDLARAQPGRLKEVERLLGDVERQAALAARLPAVLRSEDTSKDAAETAAFADVAFRLRHYAASARLYAEAFRVKPALARDLQAAHRSNAARAAALAGAGRGQDQPPLDEAARARWRQQAFDWLGADLAARTQQLESGSPRAKAQVYGTLQGWKLDRELAGIRDDEAVTALPQPEQRDCRALWAEVDRVSKVCGAGSP
jgi:serine/threonine-protein kinase